MPVFHTRLVAKLQVGLAFNRADYQYRVLAAFLSSDPAERLIVMHY